MKVPQLDLRAQHEPLRESIQAAVGELFETQQFILGPAVERFERAMAEWLGLDDCLGVASGSEALRMALAILDVGPGDDVLLPSFTFFATAGAVVHTGARPIFVDVNEDFLMDPEDARRALTPNSKAILLVHLFGLQVPWRSWQELADEHGLILLEDAAQSIGSRRDEGASGTLGETAAFSFFPSKNLGGAGDGGLLTCKSPDVMARARRYRNHGEARRYHHEEVGINGRLDALQAAVLTAKLPHVCGWNERRRACARRYEELLTALNLEDRLRLPRLPAAEEHVFHQYTVRAAGRVELLAHLKEREIGAAVYYPVPLHQQPCFRDLSGNTRDLPLSEKMAAEVLSLPIYPELEEAQQAYVAECIGEFYARR